jgi:hypothetical protein
LFWSKSGLKKVFKQNFFLPETLEAEIKVQGQGIPEFFTMSLHTVNDLGQIPE